jgi:hypothetical protein
MRAQLLDPYGNKVLGPLNFRCPDDMRAQLLLNVGRLCRCQSLGRTDTRINRKLRWRPWKGGMEGGQLDGALTTN